jgi:hypothetical protein
MATRECKRQTIRKRPPELFRICLRLFEGKSHYNIKKDFWKKHLNQLFLKLIIRNL